MAIYPDADRRFYPDGFGPEWLTLSCVENPVGKNTKSKADESRKLYWAPLSPREWQDLFEVSPLMREGEIRFFTHGLYYPSLDLGQLLRNLSLVDSTLKNGLPFTFLQAALENVSNLGNQDHTQTGSVRLFGTYLALPPQIQNRGRFTLLNTLIARANRNLEPFDSQPIPDYPVQLVA